MGTKHIMGTLAAAGILVSSVVLSEGTASAATGWNRCPNGYLCLFDGANGTGTMGYFKKGSPNLAGQRLDNRVSSVWNRSGDYFDAYDGYRCEDSENWLITSWGGQYNLSAEGGNNRWSSVWIWNDFGCSK